MSVAPIVTAIATGVWLSNLKNFRIRIQIQKLWNRSGVGVWRWDSDYLW